MGNMLWLYLYNSPVAVGRFGDNTYSLLLAVGSLTVRSLAVGDKVWNPSVLHMSTPLPRRGAMHEGSQAEGKGNGSRFELISQKINCKRLNLFKILQPLEIIYVVQIH